MKTITAPALTRVSMAWRPFQRRAGPVGFNKKYMARRLLLVLLVLVSSSLAAGMIKSVLAPQGLDALKWSIIMVFTLLFGWISITFWTAIMGFILLMARFYPFSRSVPAGDLALPVKAAVVMPVFNEDVIQVTAAIETMYESLASTGQGEHFSFFVLSDSDKERQWRKEEEALVRLCEKIGGHGRIFYRHRKIRIHKKSGNIADFCRRWGSQYRYMIVLDADSLMTGGLMVNLVKIMERRQDIGILQTAPKGINQTSLISRLNQFASHLYGPLFLAGSYFWQADEGGFWGHNAIIRLRPFMEFCGLPKLPGSLPFGGEILSHDFVEAALMRRAGWGVWLAYDLEGSFEGLPPDLLTEFERDQRWCRGNIQHLRLMFMKGIALGHRLLFLNGNMFYFSALLWLVMLLLMTANGIAEVYYMPQYFSAGRSLFPIWPVQYRHLSMELLAFTAVFLFLPKILSVVWAAFSGCGCRYGGVLRLSASVALETMFSIILAPIRMLFHSWFIMTSFLGGRFDWKKQSRRVERTSISRAIKAHWLGTAIALVWGLAAFSVSQSLFLWISVIVIPLLAAVPLSMFLSSSHAGLFLKRCGLFLTPTERNPPTELVLFNRLTAD